MSKKLWGGRFGKKTNPMVEDFTKSIQYDYQLAKYDILGSIVHVEILKKAQLLTNEEADSLLTALDSIKDDIAKERFKFNYNSEDIHTNIQNALQKKVKDLALKLHTARSRNDQVVFATKFYCYFEILEINICIKDLMIGIKKLTLRNENKDIIIPGFTHMQHAQPVYLIDHLRVYFDMLDRDSKRLKYIAENITLTLGAGALAGTPIASTNYNIKVPEALKEMEDFAKSFKIEATKNSLDVVSDRDFVIEILSALSIVGMHLSRLSEDLIIWSTKEFDFVEIDESYCTGSSLMPQKKNPDVLELIRGYAGRLYGNLISVLTMMKGLPLTYNRDMQLDKEPLFSSIEIVSKELKVLTGIIKTLKFNKDKIEDALKDESLYATDLVYYLINKDEPFAKAHSTIGRLIKYSIDNKVKIEDMTQDQLNMFSKKLKLKEIMELFDPEVSVKSKKSIKREN